MHSPTTIWWNNYWYLWIHSYKDSLWIVGYILELAPCPSWGGFIKMAVKSDQYETSRIEILPFINLEPSNPSTIYTALCFAQKLCKKHGLQICPVTFDQPLYIKAAEIVAAEQDLDKIIVHLGGFHLLMSYLGYRATCYLAMPSHVHFMLTSLPQQPSFVF